MDRNDTLTIAGMGLLVTGVWMISPAAALMVAGIMLMAAGIMGALNKARKGSGE